MNGNERYILEGIIIVLAAAYIFYENVLMSFILSPYVYIHYRQRIKERIVHDKKNFKKKFKDGIIAVSFALNVGYSIENAFGQAVDELTLMYGGDSDIVVKFKHIVIRLGQNENLEDILDDFAEESRGYHVFCGDIQICQEKWWGFNGSYKEYSTDYTAEGRGYVRG